MSSSTDKKISPNLNPASDARQMTRKEWDEIEEAADEITDRDILRALQTKFSYTNAGSGFSKVVREDGKVTE